MKVSLVVPVYNEENTVELVYQAIRQDRGSRAGRSKYNLWKLWSLALDGISSFSTVPLRVWTYIGAALSLCTLTYALYLIFDYSLNGNPLPGYSSLMVSILLGEDIGRIYLESKHRPRYVIKSVVAYPSQVVDHEKRAMGDSDESL